MGTAKTPYDISYDCSESETSESDTWHRSSESGLFNRKSPPIQLLLHHKHAHKRRISLVIDATG